MNAKVTTEMNTDEVLSGILEIGPNEPSSGSCPIISLISDATSFGPEPGGNEWVFVGICGTQRLVFRFIMVL